MAMAKILNTVFCALGVFLVCFLWIVYSLKEVAAAAGLAAVVSAAAGYVVYCVQREADSRKQRKKAERKKTEALANHLRFGANNGELFQKLLAYYNFRTVSTEGEDIVATKNGQNYYFALRYAADSVSREESVKAVVAAKRAHCAKLYIFAHKADLSACADGGVPTVFADVANVRALLEQSDLMPRLDCKKTAPKSHFAAKYAFSRRRFGLYITTTLFLLAVTAVSYVKWYTLAWATVSLCCAVYCLVNRRYNALPTAVTLD